MAPTASLVLRLRQETRVHHDALENLPFFAAARRGRLALESYVSLLRALAVVHAVLEEEVGTARAPVLRGMWSGRRKLPLLERDLACFESGAVADVAEAARAALELAARIRLWSAREPVALIGCVTVLEGSALGAPAWRPQLAERFGLTPDSGLAYLAADAGETNERWEELGRRVDAAGIGDADRRRIVAAASETHAGIARIVAALHPIEQSPLHPLATSLNPHAGSHSVTRDPRELLAALDAGERTWEAFPYFAERYGERGRAFTRSDSGWQVALCSEPQDHVTQQIFWLGRVLSSRGMPRILLEHHLRNLRDALARAVPARSARYEKLRVAAEALAAARRARIPDAVFVELAAEFERAVGPAWSERMRGTGQTLLSAVADERDGIGKAVQSIEGWLSDPSRFPERWCDAVRSTLRRARAAPGSR